MKKDFVALQLNLLFMGNVDPRRVTVSFDG